MGLEVFVADEQSNRPVACERWAALAEAVLRAEKVRGDAEFSVLYVDEATITAHAERFLGQDGPTDVLAFPIEDDPMPSGRSPDGGGNGPGWEPPEPEGMPLLLGDVVICPEVAWRNAARNGVAYEDELALLLVHGILHLLGMDHEIAEEAEVMEAREQELLDAYYRQPAAPAAASTPGDAGETAGPLPEGAPLPDAPLPGAPLPDAPLPDAPLPDAPLPDAPLPDAPLPDAPLPDAGPLPGGDVAGSDASSDTAPDGSSP